MRLPLGIAAVVTTALALAASRPGLPTRVARGEPPCHENPHLVGPCFKMRGVLSPANGSPSYRIWRVGTKRIFGVEERSDRLGGYCALPRYLRETIALGHKEITADFLVCPLTLSRLGVMQMVCVDTATNILIRHSAFFGPH